MRHRVRGAHMRERMGFARSREKYGGISQPRLRCGLEEIDRRDKAISTGAYTVWKNGIGSRAPGAPRVSVAGRAGERQHRPRRAAAEAGAAGGGGKWR